MGETRDFRLRDPAAQAEARRIAVAMVKDGATRIVAAQAVGVNRRYVGEWVKAEREHGDSALDGKRRGRRPGEQKALTREEERRIRKLVVDKCPDQLKLPFALWTREAVALLIERKTTKQLSVKAVGRYLKAWGMSPQRPMRRATERSEAAVQHWLRHDYPALKARAKAEKAEIHWADETGVSNQANYGRSYAPVGQTPVIARPAARYSQSMISSITNRGTMRFMIYDGALNAKMFLRFIKRLVKDAKRKIFLIVDNLPVHNAKLVRAWVAENNDKIELVFLPPYAPDRNPDEFLNNDLKQAIAKRATPKDRASLKAHITSHMRALQRRPDKVRSFFQAPTVRYAA